MTEKGMAREDLEEVLAGFERRQEDRFLSLEERVKQGLSAAEERMSGLEERVVHQFHIISEGLSDQIKLVAEGHVGILHRLDRIEKENERQHSETRALIKLSYAELDRRLSDLESQMKEVQEWRKKVESRYHV